MGTREFPAYYEWGASDQPPIADSLDLGLMVYDVFNLHEYKRPKTSVSLYRAKLESGVIDVPPFDSPLVLKPKGGTEKC